MTIIAVVNSKGGVGKTTLALNLVAGYWQAGADVLAVDGDPQRSLLAALANRPDDQAIAAVAYQDGKEMRQQVLQAKSKYRHIVIDAGGRDNTGLRAALLLADLVLVPFQPRSFDVWGLDDMVGLLSEARAIQDVHAYTVLSMADSAGRDNMEAAESVPEGLLHSGLSVGRRKVLATLAGQGRGILEAPGEDRKAAAEIQKLYSFCCKVTS